MAIGPSGFRPIEIRQSGYWTKWVRQNSNLASKEHISNYGLINLFNINRGKKGDFEEMSNFEEQNVQLQN